MPDAPAAYPLAWPPGFPRTPLVRREKGSQFSKVTLPGALAGLNAEIDRMAGKSLVLSSNCTLGVSQPADPGVCAYFIFEREQVAIPCDRWSRVEANVRAIALTVEAMRGMVRWGTPGMIKAMFRGFVALPGRRHWRDVLEFGAGAIITPDEVRARRGELARTHHPDRGGSDARMSEINVAVTEALAELANA